LNLLLDENLSPRLIQRLVPLFPGLTHVRDVGLKCAPDETIWEWAKETVIQEWIDTARELGRPIPEPKGRLLFA